MSQDEAAGSLYGEESEAEYVDRKTKEYLAKREQNTRKMHFNYNRRR